LTIETERQWTGKHEGKVDVLFPRTPNLIEREELVVVKLYKLLKSVHFLDSQEVFSEEIFETFGQDVQLDVTPAKLFAQVVFR